MNEGPASLRALEPSHKGENHEAETGSSQGRLARGQMLQRPQGMKPARWLPFICCRISAEW